MEEVGRSPGRLRIAWCADTPNGRPIHPDVLAVLESVAEALTHLGHEVVNRGMGVDLAALYQANIPLGGANYAAGMKRMIERVGHEPEPHELEPLTWAALNGARKVSGADALYSAQERRMRARDVLQFFETTDVFLTPVMGTAAAPQSAISIRTWCRRRTSPN